MTVTLEIPEELALRLGPCAARLSREAPGLEAIRQGLWAEGELGQFLGLGRLALDRFLNAHGIELAYDSEDLERERNVHRDIAAT